MTCLQYHINNKYQIRMLNLSNKIFGHFGHIFFITEMRH